MGESHRSQVKSDFSALPSLDITCRMVSAKLTILMTLVMMLVIALRRCEGYSPQPSEDTEGLERQARAPFNGMRGKRLPLSLNMYKKLLLKRAPFNGMRGKRDYEDLDPYVRDGDDLDLWTAFQEEKRGRGMSSGFVGMRG